MEREREVGRERGEGWVRERKYIRKEWHTDMKRQTNGHTDRGRTERKTETGI